MKKLIFLLGCTILVSCSQKTVEPVAIVETVPPTAEEIAQGKDLYLKHCMKCHKPKVFAPGDFTIKQWTKVLPKMSRKAKIDAIKSNLIRAYVLSGAKK